MDPCQNINDHPHNRLPRVDDLKGDQPTCRKIGKQSPDIKIDDLVNEDGKCIHEYRLVMVSMVWLGTYAPSAPHYNQNRLAKTIFHSRLGKGSGLALFLPSPKLQIVLKTEALKAPAYSPTSRA